MMVGDSKPALTVQRITFICIDDLPCFTKIINNNGDMGQPWGIGFSWNGKWAVANHSNHCVYLYDGEDQ